MTVQSKFEATFHPLDPRDAKTLEGLLPLLVSHKGEMRGVGARGAFDAIMQRTPVANDIDYTFDTVGSVSGWWCRPPNAKSDRAVLYLHGGWFVWGSSNAYRNFVGHIAAGSNTAVFIPDYRLAPEHPFPAAVEDSRDVYNGLVERHYRDLAVVGDSAGGALAIELMASFARDNVERAPKGAVLFSPLTDLTLSGDSWESRSGADPYFTKEQARELVKLYLDGANPADPRASPLNRDLKGLPPFRIHTGNDEVLLDDSRRLAHRASVAGVDVSLDVWEGMTHVFPTGIGLFEASRRVLDEVGTFLAQSLLTKRGE
jgi:acetyl esterase/lipase